MSIIGGFCYDDNKFAQFSDEQIEMNIHGFVSAYRRKHNKFKNLGWCQFSNNIKKNKFVIIYEIEDVNLVDDNGEYMDIPIEEKCDIVVSKAVEFDNQLQTTKQHLLQVLKYCGVKEQEANKQLLKIIMRILSRQTKVIEDIKIYKQLLLEDLEKYKNYADDDIKHSVLRTTIKKHTTDTDIRETNEGTYIEIADNMKDQLELITDIISHYEKCKYWNVDFDNLQDLTETLEIGFNYLRIDVCKK